MAERVGGSKDESHTRRPANRRSLVSIRAIAKLGTALVVLLPLAACTASPPAHPAASATGQTHTIALPRGNVHLTDYAINTDGPASSVILTGAVGDFGAADAVKPDGSPDPEHTSQLKLTLRHGSFRIDIATLDARLKTAFQRFPADPNTCSGTVSVHATAPIVAGVGTGAYAGLRGSFELTATVDEVDAQPCDGTGSFVQQTIIMTGTGTVSPS
jgi:hypothetical protein